MWQFRFEPEHIKDQQNDFKTRIRGEEIEWHSIVKNKYHGHMTGNNGTDAGEHQADLHQQYLTRLIQKAAGMQKICRDSFNPHWSSSQPAVKKTPMA